MAAIVNARDVQLQAAPTRVANITMAPNLIVDQSQVDGLGIVVDGTKFVTLSASAQVFQIAKTGTVSPASTTLTANLRNLTAAPTLTVTSGTITPAPTLTNGTVTIAHDAMTTDSATLRLSVTQDGKTYTDTITLVKVREGTDALVGFLTNEAHTIPADTLGNALGYTGAGGTFKVFQGTTDITSLCTFSTVSNASDLTHSIGATTGVYSVTGGFNAAATTATITYRATFGTATIDKTFSLAKLKDGMRGSRTFYVALTGTTNTYSDTLATTTVTNAGGAVFQDIVTQYNDGIDPGFSQSKFWDGSAWQTINAVVDGNLLVKGTVAGDRIVANSIQGDRINAVNLSAIKASLGTVQIDAGGYLRTAGVTSYGAGTGIFMGQDAGVYKLRVGNPSGNRLQWDGTSLTIVGGGTFTGSLSAASGTFAGAVNVGSYTSYAWPASGGTGAHLSSQGLLLGNANDGRYLQVTSAGEIYAPNFTITSGGLWIGSGFSVTSGGAVSADTIDIKRRTVLQGGTVDPAKTVSGGYMESTEGGSYWVPIAPGNAIKVEVSQLFFTDIYDPNARYGVLNQPYFVQCWPSSNPNGLRNWSGENGTTLAFSFTARCGPVRNFSNAGMYADDGRIAFEIRAVVYLIAGSFTSFTLPPIEWSVYRI